MADDLEPLGSLARRVLDAEEKRSAASDEMRDRVLGRITASIALAAPPHPSPDTAAPVAAKGIAAGLTAKAAPWIVAAFIAGGGAGAAVHASLVPTPALPSSSVAPSALPPPRIADSVIAPPEPSSAAVPVVSVGSLPSLPGTPAHTASANAGSDADLAAERALVDRARMALARGQSGAALEAIDAHASTYPRGRLAEEREVLAVQALAQAGRTAEARARAARFHANYPKSVFAAAVDSAVGNP